jgi:formate-dependent nitrite reductase membrane component NrfD
VSSSKRGPGRHIDERLGALGGEGAQQRLEGEVAEPAPLDVWPTPPSPGPAGDPTYFERPVLKEPVWIWAVPAYFFVGGAAGAASVLGEVAESLSDGELDDLVRRARWIGAAGGALGTALLIHDLGRPGRFLNMLRVFRPSSPMSMGSWALAAAAPLFAASAVLPHAGGALGRLGNAVGKVAALLGLPLAGYTAVLLSTTAIPLWQSVRHSLPVLFVASAASSAGALLQLSRLNDQEHAVVHRFALAAEIGELAAAAIVERQASRVQQVGRPLREGLSGALWRASTAASAAGLTLSLLPGRSRARDTASALIGIGGGLAVRFALFEAGKASARDPRATFGQQRAGGGAAELRGSWRPPGAP